MAWQSNIVKGEIRSSYIRELQRLLSYVRRAVDDYGMIEEGDKIAVGVSGGKDSLAMLEGLSELRRFYPKKFTLAAVTIDMGFDGVDFSDVAEFCSRRGIEYKIVPTDIYKIIFEVRKEPNPCSLCARMRRGAIHDAAKELGCNKIALGHHYDDVVETFMLNLFYEGRIGCFSPVTYLSRKDITLIRPMLYMPEKTIKEFTKKVTLPIVETPCPADKNSERANMKALLAGLERDSKGLKTRIFGAIARAGVDGFEAKGKLPYTEQ